MNKRNFIGILLVLVGLVAAGLRGLPDQNITLPGPEPAGQDSITEAPLDTAVLGERTKADGCLAENGLPDSQCTPGAIFSEVTKEQVCTPGYSKSVRNVSSSVKNEAYAEYGITTHRPGEYEVDHLVSLELGGSNEIANLWPESAEPRPGYHEKDRVENYLHDQVCSGTITLEQAQQAIAGNWLAVYQQISP